MTDDIVHEQPSYTRSSLSQLNTQQPIYENLTRNTSPSFDSHPCPRSMKKKFCQAFDFLRVWEQTFRDLKSETVVAEQILERDRHDAETSGGFWNYGRKDYVIKRRLSLEEHLQIRLGRMTFIAQTLSRLLWRERERRLKLFRDANTCFLQAEKVIDELIASHDRHVTELRNKHRLELESLRHEKRLFEASRTQYLATISAQRETIRVLQQETEEKGQLIGSLKDEVGSLERQNRDLIVDIGTLRSEAGHDDGGSSRLARLRLDDEVRHRKHLEVLLEIGLCKLRYLERANGLPAPGRQTSPASRNAALGVDKADVDLCAASEDEQWHFLSDDATVSSIASVDSAASDSAAMAAESNGNDNKTKRQSVSAGELDGEETFCAKQAKRKGRKLLRRLLKGGAGSSDSEPGSSLVETPIAGQAAKATNRNKKEGDREAHVNLLDERDDDAQDKDESSKEKPEEHEADSAKEKNAQQSSPRIVEHKPPRARMGNVAKDVGRKLRRKQRARTIEIPRLSIEDIRAMNKTHEWH